MRALGPYLASRCCASALLSPWSGSTASLASTLSTGIFSRSMLSPTFALGGNAVGCAEVAGMDCSPSNAADASHTLRSDQRRLNCQRQLKCWRQLKCQHHQNVIVIEASLM